jgi:cyclopropane fatty-acyl-phospholipid synthase-like methyltransferase
MFWYLFKISILSLLIVIFIHHIIIYFKNSLTTPKIIDCVNKPKKEYENIKEILKNIKEEDIKEEDIKKEEKEDIVNLDTMREELTSHINNIQ